MPCVSDSTQARRLLLASAAFKQRSVSANEKGPDFSGPSFLLEHVPYFFFSGCFFSSGLVSGFFGRGPHAFSTSCDCVGPAPGRSFLACAAHSFHALRSDL